MTLPDVIAYAERTLREFHLGGTRATTAYGPVAALARTLRALRAVKKVMDDADGRYGADAGVLSTDELRTAIEEGEVSLTTGRWYRPCADHAHTIARMPFDAAYTAAQECDACQTGEGVDR